MIRLSLVAVLFLLSAVAASAADWTILVFLNANNNLDPFSYQNMNEMETVGSTDRVNVVVQVTHRGADSTLRYLMKKDGDVKNVTSPVVEKLAKQDMGDAATLQQFVEWGMQKYPAKHYLVDIWNHGSGWEKKMAAAPIVRGISYDDSTGHHISTPQLGAVLKAAAARRGAKLDVVGYDACLMQMAEVASEVSEGALYQVGSEEVEPGQGWPYAEWLAQVAAHPESDGAAVGKALVSAFQKSYAGGSHGTETSTLSLIDLGRVDALSKACDAFTSAVLADKAARKDLVAAIGASQAFEDPAHHDLTDLVAQVQARLKSPAVKQSGDAVKSAASALVLATGTTGAPVAKAAGVAIWAPTFPSDSVADYAELRWARQGRWADLVNALGGRERDLQRMANAAALFGE